MMCKQNNSQPHEGRRFSTMDKMCFGVGVVVGGLLPAAAVAIAGFRTGAALIMGVLLIIQAIAVLGIMYILLAQVGALDHGGMLK